MIFKVIGKKITTLLIEAGTIDEADRDLYEYAVYYLLLSMLPIFLSFVFGCMMRIPIESLFFIMPFVVMRKYSGGYHAKFAWVCMLGSCFILISGLYLVSIIDINLMIWVQGVFSLIVLMIFSPIDSENKRLTENEKKCYKKKASILGIGFIVSAGIFQMVSLNNIAVSIIIGIYLVALLQIPYVISVIFINHKKKC